MAQRLRVAVCNLQSGVATTRGWWHYLTTGWRYLLPHDNDPIRQAGRFLAEQAVDLALCTEVEGGSARSRGEDQAALLGSVSGLAYCAFFPTLRRGRRICQGNAILSRHPLHAVANHRLSGHGEPRFLSEARLELAAGPLRCYVTHLSLERKVRRRQIGDLARYLGTDHQPRLLGGDFNISHRGELELLRQTVLQQARGPATFPAWRPRRQLDHLFVSPTLEIENTGVFDGFRFADHLPLVVDLRLG